MTDISTPVLTNAIKSVCANDHNSIIQMLGVYMMELWFGKPIETYQTAGQLTTVDASSHGLTGKETNCLSHSKQQSAFV